MWFDTHAHLSDAQFDLDRNQAIDRAVKAGVTQIVEIADGPAEWEKARRLAERFPDQLWWAAGLHPYYAAEANDDVWRRLRDLCRHPQFVALGEVGLDYAKSTVPADIQQTAFTSALELAVQIDKPLIIHCRAAYADLMPALRRYFSSQEGRNCPGVVHCFSGNLEEARELISMGFFLGIDGPLTYPSAKPLRAVVSELALSRLVLETDSPYLPPQSHRGQRNEPAYLPAIGQKLAELTGNTLEQTAGTLTSNGLTLFRLIRAV